jgi:hypothetical protein
LILGKAFVRAATLKSHHKKKEGTVIMMEWKILEAGNPMNKQENTPTNPFALGNSMGMAMYVAGTTNGNGDGAGGSGEGNMYFPKNFDHSPTFLVSESVSSPTYVSHQPIQPELENLSVGTVDMQNFDENASVDFHQLFPNHILHLYLQVALGSILLVNIQTISNLESRNNQRQSITLAKVSSLLYFILLVLF